MPPGPGEILADKYRVERVLGSGAMGIVVNRIPQLGKVSDNVWYCQGYSGHGVATSHIMGEIMAEAITGTLEQFDTFAACRHIRVPTGPGSLQRLSLEARCLAVLRDRIDFRMTVDMAEHGMPQSQLAKLC